MPTLQQPFTPAKWLEAKPIQMFCTANLASYPGLLTPAFVACRTNAGEGLVKLSHVVWRTWTCGGVAEIEE